MRRRRSTPPRSALRSGRSGTGSPPRSSAAAANGTPWNRRAEQIRDAIEHERKSYDRGKYEARLARLVSGVANVRVGGVTESAWKARYKACENALNTARAAAADGVVPGGGVALARAAFALEDDVAGRESPRRRAFTRALGMPFRRIAGAAGCEPSIALEALKGAAVEIGFDARTGASAPGGRLAWSMRPADGDGAHQRGRHRRSAPLHRLRRRPRPPSRRGVERIRP